MSLAWAQGHDVLWLRPNLSFQFLEFAFSYLSEGSWDRAEVLSKKCLAVDPANLTALCNLGVVSEKRGDLPQAAMWYERALSTDPRHVPALYNLSVVLWRQEAWDKVVPLLDRVLALDPNHADARRYLPAARARLAERNR